MLVIRRISIISFLCRLAILRKVIRIPVHYWPQFWLCHCFILYEYIIYYVNSIRELRYSLGTRDHMLRSKLYTKDLIEQKQQNQKRNQYHSPPGDNIKSKIIDMTAH